VGASAATVDSAKNSELDSSVLVDGQGRTLYLFEKDRPGSSSCSGSCAQAWPPLMASGAPLAGPGVTATLLGTIGGRGGQRQVTYSGHPLYYYASDTKAGQTNGEGLNQFGAEWYVVSPQGNKVEKEGS
jgi:predicted lipoprotein with Yx(FWY)xxD motif